MLLHQFAHRAIVFCFWSESQINYTVRHCYTSFMKDTKLTNSVGRCLFLNNYKKK